MAHGVEIDPDKLRLARLRKGLSWNALEKACQAAGGPGPQASVSRANVGRYERGELRPSAKTLLAMATALGLDVTDLLADTAPNAKAAAA